MTVLCVYYLESCDILNLNWNFDENVKFYNILIAICYVEVSIFFQR